MKFVIQRVQHASVTVDNEVIGKIGKGFLVLIGVSEEDNTEIADKMIKKLIGMRIFEDENGKTNLALKDVNGELLLISQFTLYADCKKGNRPSFIKAGAYGHFPRPSGPRSPTRQGHIKRPVLRLAEPSFLRPANQCC